MRRYRCRPQIVLTHSDINRIRKDTEQLIRDHEVMGCKYIGIGSMPEKYRNPDWIRRFAVDFKEPARMIKEAGMRLMYHNHAFEFEKAGGDVCQWIERLADRIPCVHLKDRGIVNGQEVMAPVMEGNMNFPAILEALKKTDCEYALVEQDTCLENPFVCLEKSWRNLAELGYR